MSEYEVGAISDFPDGCHRVVLAGKREVGVFNLDGELFALPNICPHQFGPLCEGKVNGTTTCSAATGWKVAWEKAGEILTCPWHGLEFDIRTGKSLASPRLWVRPYRVLIRDNRVVISTSREG